MQQPKRLHKLVQSLFGTDAGKISDRERVAGVGFHLAVVAAQIDPQGNPVKAVRGEIEILRHEIPVISAMNEKPIELLGASVDFRERLPAVFLGKILEENVIPLQRAKNGAGVLRTAMSAARP